MCSVWSSCRDCGALLGVFQHHQCLFVLRDVTIYQALPPIISVTLYCIVFNSSRVKILLIIISPLSRSQLSQIIYLTSKASFSKNRTFANRTDFIHIQVLRSDMHYFQNFKYRMTFIGQRKTKRSIIVLELLYATKNMKKKIYWIVFLNNRLNCEERRRKWSFWLESQIC